MCPLPSHHPTTRTPVSTRNFRSPLPRAFHQNVVGDQRDLQMML